MAGGRELAGRRAQQQVESLLGPGRKMAVGLRQVLEAGLAADDRDRGVGQAGEIAWQVAHIDAAAVFVVGEVADIVQAVLDVPVVADQGRQLLGSDPVGGQRGECVGHCGAGGPGLEDMPLAFDADRLLASVEAGIAIPCGVAEVLDPVAAAVDAVMPLVEGFARGGVGEVHALQVGQYGGLVVLDGGDHVVRAALVEQVLRRGVLGVQRVDGGGAAAVIRTPTAKARARPTLPGLLFSSTTNPTPSIESPPRVWSLTCRRE